ncbi:hypothetical protein [Marivirga sp.]|uniref:hypothetical protein n=1 Tax=Marivirga sp. TaxID=2018662 RepID=UPI003DA790E7
MFISCDEIDESPAEVNMKMSFDGNVDNNLQFSNLNLVIDEITVEADKENGEKFTFTENLNQENFSLSNGTTESLFKFNLPPAIYSNITVEISLRENQDDNSIVFTGSLMSRNPMQSDLPILFEQPGRELVDLKIKPKSGGNEIVVQRGENIEALIKIEASYIFQPINPGLLIAAENIPIDGINTVLINRNNNPEIYNLISSRIKQSFSASF